MASQKRKHPYEEASAAGPAPRRATRHSAGASTTSAEPEKQRRSGRGRANTLEGLHDTIAGPNDAEAQRKDAPKSKATPAPPAAAPLKTTRTSRGHTAEPEAEASIVVRSGKPQEKKRSAQPKATTRQPVVLPVAPSALKAEEKIQANTSRARTYVPPPKPQRQVYPQVPATSLTDPASVSSITPKRRASGAIAQPPPTPKADRNIDKVVLGNICFKTWYPSYYNKEVLGDASGNLGAQSNGGSAKIGGGKKEKEALLDRLYVCPSCFKYSKELVSWTRHVKYCQSQSHVPGTKVYTHPKNSIIAQRHPKSNDAVHADEGEWSVWEVDGERDAVSLICIAYR